MMLYPAFLVILLVAGNIGRGEGEGKGEGDGDGREDSQIETTENSLFY